MILLTIIVFLIILGILIFAHELGHFIAAKRLGVRVEEFGFGFPPKVFGIKKGETEYSLNWIPLGGFVKMTGQDDFKVLDQKKVGTDSKSFLSKRPWRRLIILISGVGMNFLLAAVLLSLGFMIGLPSAIGDETPNGSRVSDERIQVVMVSPDSPAKEADLKSADTIVKLDDFKPETVSDVQNYIDEHKGTPVFFEISRGSEIIQKEIVPRTDAPMGEGPSGIMLAETGRVSYPWYRSIYEGFKAAGQLTKQIVLAFGEIIGDLFSEGKISGSVAGPVGIAVLTGQVTKLGFVYVLQFTAILSLNLMIINILPFPGLDGGHLVFLSIEKIRGGKSMKGARIENIINLIGFSLLLALIAVVTYRDISKFWGKIVGLFT